MWPDAPPVEALGDASSDARGSVVAPCACGATRVLEMQLMPQLLFELHVDDYVTTNDRDGAAGGVGGMDWACVLIYSCPHSCDQSTEEAAFVLGTHSKQK